MREPLPSRRLASLRRFEFPPYRDPFELGIGFYDDGRIGEVFLDGPRAGSDAEALADDICILISLLLQYGAGIESIGHSLGTVPSWTPDGMGEAPASLVGKIIEEIKSAERELVT